MVSVSILAKQLYTQEAQRSVVALEVPFPAAQSWVQMTEDLQRGK